LDFGFELCQTTNPKSEIQNPKSKDTLTSGVFLHLSRNFAVFKQTLKKAITQARGEMNSFAFWLN
jgi:hypothetical protein